MPAPVIVARGLAGATAASLIWEPPSGRLVDDILILIGETANQIADTPLFWNDETLTTGSAAFDSVVAQNGTGTAGGTTSTRIAAWWRRIDGSESYPNGQFYIPDPGDHQIYGYLLVRGCITTGVPIEAPVTSLAAAATTAVAFPGITTLGADRCIVSAVANATDSGTGQLSGTPTNADLSDIATEFNLNFTGGNGGGIACFSGKRAAAGVVGAGAGTLLTASVQARLTFALKPPALAESAGGFWL